MAGWADCRLHILGQGPWGKERAQGESMWTVIYEQSELNYWTVQELIFESMPWPDWTCYLSSLAHNFQTNKERNKFIISTHMAGTWLPEGTRERLSVQRGVTGAKSQTLALYTIRVLLMKSELGSQVEAARLWSDMCSFFLSQQGGVINFYCSFLLNLDFPLGTSANPEVVTGLPFSLPFSPWTPIPPSLTPFIPIHDSCVWHTRQRQNRSACSQSNPLAARES